MRHEVIEVANNSSFDVMTTLDRIVDRLETAHNTLCVVISYDGLIDELVMRELEIYNSKIYKYVMKNNVNYNGHNVADVKNTIREQYNSGNDRMYKLPEVICAEILNVYKAISVQVTFDIDTVMYIVVTEGHPEVHAMLKIQAEENTLIHLTTVLITECESCETVSPRLVSDIDILYTGDGTRVEHKLYKTISET